MINNLLKLKDKNFSYVLKHSLKSSFVQILGNISVFVVSIYIARSLGSDAVGILGLSNKIANILVMIGIFGLHKVIVKFVSYEYKIKNYKKINDILYSSKKYTLRVSLLLLLISLITTPFLSKYVYDFDSFALILSIILLGIIFQIRSRILSGFLIAFNKIWQGNLVDKGLTPIYMILLFIIYYLLKIEINIITIAFTYFLARFLMNFTVEIFLKSIISVRDKSLYVINEMLPMGKSVMIISITAILFKSIDIIILGVFVESSMVGLFHVAEKLAIINIIFLTVFTKSIGPKLSVLYKNNELLALNKLLIKTSLFLTIIGFLVFTLIIFFGKPILSIWGSEFIDAYLVLIILSFGQLVNISTSVCGETLIMCGLENLHKKINLYFLIIHFFLSLILIYFHGILGASISFTIITISVNLLKLYFCRNKLNLFVLNA